MNIITPIANKDGMVFYGQNGLNVYRIYGVHSANFLQMHADLAEYGLKVRAPDARIQVDFVFYCHGLVTACADVRTLIYEFNSAQTGDGTDLMHALSLAKLYYHYNLAGYDISILRTHKNLSTADLVVENIKCDLKVRHDQTWRRMERHLELLSNGKQDEYYEIFSNEIRTLDDDLMSALRNRAEEGFKQADCLIFDLSSHFHSWNYHRLNSLQKVGGIMGLSVHPVPPIAGMCILFSPDNALDLNHGGFNPKAYWGYLSNYREDIQNEIHAE